MMELKFTAATKPKTVDGIAKQRAKLIKRIDEQIAILVQHEGGPLPRKSWAWVDDKGDCLVGISYGYRPIELKKGMFAVQCEGIEQAADALATIREMVIQGDYDTQLAKASTEIRAKFSAERR